MAYVSTHTYTNQQLILLCHYMLAQNKNNKIVKKKICSHYVFINKHTI